MPSVATSRDLATDAGAMTRSPAVGSNSHDVTTMTLHMLSARTTSSHGKQQKKSDSSA